MEAPVKSGRGRLGVASIKLRAVPPGGGALFALVVAAFSVLIALGVWQLQRREWKAGVISRLARSLKDAPVPYMFPSPPAPEKQPREFKRVTVTGRFVERGATELFAPTPAALRSKTEDGFGYLLFEPLDTGQSVIFVNRGFVPQRVYERGPAKPPAGEVTVEGILRLSDPGNWFTPAPDLAKHLFFSADIAAMAAMAELPPGSTVATEYLDAAPSSNNAGWPVARDPSELLASIPNSHLQYALTWFGLAAGLAGVYLFQTARK